MKTQKIIELAKERIAHLKKSLGDAKTIGDLKTAEHWYLYGALQEAEYFERETWHLINTGEG